MDKSNKMVLSCEFVAGPQWSAQGLRSRASEALAISARTGKIGLINVEFTTAYGQVTTTTFKVYEAKA